MRKNRTGLALLLKIPAMPGGYGSFPAQPTNASSNCRQVPLTLPPKVSGAPAGTRTQDPRLKRALLYQLSYRSKY